MGKVENNGYLEIISARYMEVARCGQLMESMKVLIEILLFMCIAGQSFSFNNGFAFSTYDRDVDSSPLYNIAEQKHGAWWYRNNGVENLNGHYVTPGTLSSYYYGSGGVVYGLFDGHLSLKSTEMKFRKKY